MIILFKKLEDQPTLEHCCLHSAYEGLRPIEPNSTTLAAWQSGETGIPFVDACMRFLNSTGWLNFRMRSMLMAVASYHLWLDWRVTGLHLAQKFTDFEPGIHWPQVQMQSGDDWHEYCTYIYNPIKQGLDQDPTGIFTRRWVPELNCCAKFVSSGALALDRCKSGSWPLVSDADSRCRAFCTRGTRKSLGSTERK